MTNRDIGTEILKGLEEIQEYKKGKIKLKTTSSLCRQNQKPFAQN